MSNSCIDFQSLAKLPEQTFDAGIKLAKNYHFFETMLTLQEIPGKKRCPEAIQRRAKGNRPRV
jgi:hypothetical protein